MFVAIMVLVFAVVCGPVMVLTARHWPGVIRGVRDDLLSYGTYPVGTRAIDAHDEHRDRGDSPEDASDCT